MKTATRLLLAMAMTLCMAPAQWAQQEEPAPAPQVGATQEEQSAPPAEEETKTGKTLTPDTRPLSGVEELRVETASRGRNYVVPSIRLSAFGDTNRSLLTTGQRGTELTGSVVAGLAAHRVSRKSDFSMDYQGGGIFYARESDLNGMLHNLAITERYKGRRWGITLGDQLAYMPESSFGFGGFGPSMGWGGGTGSWAPPMIPGQSLYSGGGNRIFNSSLMEVQYEASARSSITFGGNYGIMRFLDPGYIESNTLFANTGYNYALTRKDTLSLNYGFGAMRFIGSDLHLDNHVISGSYGRRITGRLAFSVSGGPQIIYRRTPLLGTIRNTDVFARTTLDYRVGRTGLNWSYTHYTSNGSGIYLGAKTDLLYVTVRRQLSRNWGWSVGPGYSRNARLTTSQTASAESVYNSIYGQTSFQRKLGRYADMTLSYNINTQKSSTSGIGGTNSSTSYLRHFFGVGVTWHGSRVGLD